MLNLISQYLSSVEDWIYFLYLVPKLTQVNQYRRSYVVAPHQCLAAAAGCRKRVVRGIAENRQRLKEALLGVSPIR
jgi:hypothetical protein